jgi:nucleotide-binding universal stress UspA family protein
MSAGYLVVAICCLWVATGLVMGWVMGRRGHDPFSWGVVGVLLGPVGIAFAHWARQDALALARRSAPPLTGHRGPVDVLAGLDGSPQAEVALLSAVKLLGSRVGRLTAVTVISYDAAESAALRREQERAGEASFDRIRSELGEIQIERQTLQGRPTEVLKDLAVKDNYDTIVVGSAGRGMSKRLLGSTAESLTADSPVPIIVGPRLRSRAGSVVPAVKQRTIDGAVAEQDALAAT